MSDATSQIADESLRCMALTYIQLMEQESRDDDDIRVIYVLRMHPKMVAVMARLAEIIAKPDA